MSKVPGFEIWLWCLYLWDDGKAGMELRQVTRRLQKASHSFLPNVYNKSLRYFLKEARWTDRGIREGELLVF